MDLKNSIDITLLQWCHSFFHSFKRDSHFVSSNSGRPYCHWQLRVGQYWPMWSRFNLAPQYRHRTHLTFLGRFFIKPGLALRLRPMPIRAKNSGDHYMSFSRFGWRINLSRAKGEYPLSIDFDVIMVIVVVVEWSIEDISTIECFVVFLEKTIRKILNFLIGERNIVECVSSHNNDPRFPWSPLFNCQRSIISTIIVRLLPTLVKCFF